MQVQKVMLVDDEPDIRTIGRMSLEGVGQWDVIMASSGQDALQQAQVERPDVVLLDVMMPVMDGPATFQKLRELPRWANVPIIFLTAKTQKSECEYYLTLGAAGVIQKPFDPITLPEQVEHLVNGRSSRRLG